MGGHNHYLKRCKGCQVVMGQCRCIGPKETEWVLCGDCKKSQKEEAVSKRQPFLCRDCNSPCSFDQTVTDENSDGVVYKLDIYKCDKCSLKWSD